jgi:hypothetical protein
MLGSAAAKGLAAGSVRYAPSSVLGLAFGFIAAVAIVAIAVFGCAGHKNSSGGKKPRHQPEGGGFYLANGSARVEDGGSA